jgi:hypothetical protein
LHTSTISHSLTFADLTTRGILSKDSENLDRLELTSPPLRNHITIDNEYILFVSGGSTTSTGNSFNCKPRKDHHSKYRTDEESDVKRERKKNGREKICRRLEDILIEKQRNKKIKTDNYFTLHP